MCSMHSRNFSRRSSVEVAEDLPVGRQPAGADAEDEATFEQGVEHRHLGRDRRRMAVREVDRARAERDALRHGREAREEHARVGHRLGAVGDVLADERLREAERVGEHDRLAVLAERLQ